MNKKQKKMLIRIIVASVLLIGLTLVTHLIEINSILNEDVHKNTSCKRDILSNYEDIIYKFKFNNS